MEKGPNKKLRHQSAARRKVEAHQLPADVNTSTLDAHNHVRPKFLERCTILAQSGGWLASVPKPVLGGFTHN